MTEAEAHANAIFASACEEVEEYAESPIETDLMAAVVTLAKVMNSKQPKLFDFALLPQHKWNRYRIDFAVEIIRAKKNNLIFIECDGHDFHERTKEQARYDRQKDRAIQMAGIPLLRFTGSEIFTDLYSCAGDILFFIKRRERELQ